MKIKIKKTHPDAQIPRNAYKNDAGYDLRAVSPPEIKDSYIVYDTGIAIQPVDDNIHTEVFPRSSIAKTDLVLANSIGLVDQNFTSSVKILFKVVPRISVDKDGNISLSKEPPVIYHQGDKIAQLVVRKTEKAEFEEVEELNQTERNEGMLGSSGK